MPRRRFPLSKRFFIASRAGFKCEYCQTPEDFSPDLFNIEHIVPLLHHGTDEDDNLAHACGGCNANKHGHVAWQDPQTGELTALFHPRNDEWRVHFAWNEDFTLLLGLTSKGRAIFRIGRQEKKLSEKRIRDIHRQIIAAETPEEEQEIGQWKKSGNHVINYRGEKFEFTAPSDVPETMHTLLNRLNANLDQIHRGDPKAPHPLLLAFEFHQQYLTIHPFMDGNGRTARLLTNLLLVSLNYPPFWVLEGGEKEQYNRYLADVQCYGGSPDLLYTFLAGLVERSLQLMLDALEGKEIEDMDDWKKAVRILKSELTDTDHFTRSKSREAIDEVFYNSVQPAVLKIMEELREFEALFISLQPFFGGDGRLMPLSAQNTLEDNYKAQNVNTVFEFNYNLLGFKKSEKPFDIHLRLKWCLNEYSYNFTMAPTPQSDGYELPYDRFYDDRIMQQIVKDCAEFVLNEIKNRQKNGR